MKTSPKTIITKQPVTFWAACAAVSANLCATVSVLAATLHVPGDYPTIQAAVGAAAPSGDEILIAPGVYNQQVVINGKALTLTGTNGTILSAWTGMTLRQPGPSYMLIAATTNADVVVRNIDFEGNRLEQSLAPNTPFGALLFWGAGGRVENCTIQGFRGVTHLSNGGGYGLSCLNLVNTGVGIMNLQVLHNTFADNSVSAIITGDDGFGPGNPSLLRTTFTLEGNTITGCGPTSIDNQWGVVVMGGAAGLIKGNNFTGYYDTDPTAHWSIAVHALSASTPLVALQPLRFEANIFISNQVAVANSLGDNMHFINNYFEGTDGPSGYGIYVTGTNILCAINQFTNLNQGIVLADPNDPNLPPGSGNSVNPTLLANQFCNLNVPVVVEPLVTGEVELGSQYCPFPPAGFGNLTCSPGSGLPGSSVTFSGTNFTGATLVLFNGLSASFAAGTNADTLITATVPDHATTGPVTVLTPQGSITGLVPFTVPVPLAIQPFGVNEVQLSWTADAPDMLLEATADLTAPNWQTVSTSPAVGTNQVIWFGPRNSVRQFFRLCQP